MDELRVILLLAGAAVLAVVYYFSRPRKAGRGPSHSARRRETAGRGEPDDEPDDAETGGGWSALHRRDPPPEILKRELKRLGDLISRDRGAPPKRAPGEREQDRAEPPAPAPEPDPDKIVVLYVRTRKETAISGRRLIEAAEKAGLEYGEMDIYHRLDEAGKRETIFSMANMVAPGTLDQAQAPGFTTPGVALFLRLPGPLPALDAWDAMLATARRLAELLDAELLDDALSTLNRQRIQQLREEMREFDRLSTLHIRRR